MEKGKHVMTEADVGLITSTSYTTASIIVNTQKLEEEKENSCLEPSEEEWPCQYLDFGLQASRTKRE